ncbi:uncharacterized protein ASCRUDRAFT_73160 [Ascoidea rubescens DSM 1968]|uniref:Uncharacterized protein n=1 Tax=Ascoidea rubescens DSM 1968 TaxID=1344418 RepID=A0A1D2VNR6_9ASCO|nr:hypothetical protein ASCRUDRAFT_73160 [Ascoidea rubescens DSM 1968]ODV63262.1 hypothetical protein ASCRUDRAFT_73160 [Ascoidea rubescens DSM 1968]
MPYTQITDKTLLISGDVDKKLLVTSIVNVLDPISYDPLIIQIKTCNKITTLNISSQKNSGPVDIIILCYSIDNFDSFKQLFNTHNGIINHEFNSAFVIPTILVGVNSHLRKPSIKDRSGLVPYEYGKIIATEMNALTYMEVSSTTGEGISELLSCVSYACLMPIKARNSTDEFLYTINNENSIKERIAIFFNNFRKKCDNNKCGCRWKTKKIKTKAKISGNSFQFFEKYFDFK